LRFEPGICAVVGPNGSGKSNVVDALTWVMGEQGAKTLRGGKMQDVIFAGTAGRSALGRAEVTLTIDNADGALPIDYAEVSVTRRMYRDGAGEYEINGNRARLMDVQELLSDSGIGREMHVIVGQGKLSEILESRPEERRAFIEEAAGILKHRRRKEKAQRKLAGMQGNLDRLQDLTKELRRQLGPLARQAEVARRAQTVQADLRDSTLRLAADDLERRRAELADIDSARVDLTAQLAEATDARDALARVVEATARRVDELSPRADLAQQRWFALSALGERSRATRRIAADRARSLAEAAPRHTGPEPDELERQAEKAAAREKEQGEAVEAAGAALAAATAALAEKEQHAKSLEAEHMRRVRAVADRREGLARLAGKAEAVAARIESLTEQIDGYASELAAAEAAVTAADDDVAAAELRILDHGEGEESLNSTLDEAERGHEAAAQRVAELREAEHSAGRTIAGLDSRIETLRASLGVGDGSDWLAGHLGDSWKGTLAENITIDSGAEKAIGVALGAFAEAGVVPAGVDTGAALRELAEASGGRAALISEAGAGSEDGGAGKKSAKAAVGEVWHLESTLVGGARWAIDTIDAPPALRGVLAALLADVVLVEDVDSGRAQVAEDRRLRAVTRAGELVGSGWIVGGGQAGRSGVEVAAAIEAAEKERAAASSLAEKAGASLSGAESSLAESAAALDSARAAMSESDQRIEGLYKEMARLGVVKRKAEHEARRIEQSRRSARDKLDAAHTESDDLRSRISAAERESSPEDEEGANEENDAERARAQEAVGAARSAETEARLALRTAEERMQSGRGRSASLLRAAAAERDNRARAARAAAARRKGAEVAETVVELSDALAERLEQVTADAARFRDTIVAARDAAAAQLSEKRKALGEAESAVAKLADSAHRDEIARAQLEVKVSELEESVVERLGIEPDALVAEYGPEQEIPAPADEIAEFSEARERGEDVQRPPGSPYVRAEQEARKKRAEKDLATLGKVNPLALEEYSALEERHSFLSAQLDDVKKARSDLEGVIDDVDVRIEQIFTEAYADVEREFESVFQVLFPGGEGRLVLTDPDDMLATGIDVEARPPGKKVKRLSLLSGGEKSLTAVAMLVAIFKARPSPFYVMDEVEAALDDTNLRRLISLFEDLRETSQLVVITHQKPTMDVADVLYGVSMQGDGISKVISQKMSGLSS
uniref:chromosome segregation protein SMC n=1 Tax=Dietzia sp. TaxID=1871616 RepID=UPI002FD9BD7D